MSSKRTLEKLKYKILPPVGPGSFSTEGSVADLLMDIPYFFIAKIIPPIDVVNEVLQKGVLDAGMSGGCKWKPVQLDAASYTKLAADLRQMDFVSIQPPDWVTTYSDWHSWCAELVWGIPALESRQQWVEITELSAQHNAAIKAGDDHLAASLLIQVNELCAENCRFVKEHRAAQPKLPLFRRPVTKRKLNRHA
jgi:hypothetical protein